MIDTDTTTAPIARTAWKSPVQRSMFSAMYRDTLGWIVDFTVQNLHQPSNREISTAMGLKSKHGVHRRLAKLVDGGFLAMPERRFRAIEVFGHPDLTPNFDALPTLDSPVSPDALRAFAAIRQATIRDFFQPSMQDISAMLGVSVASVSKYRLKLAMANYVEVLHDKNRCIRFLARPSNAMIAHAKKKK